MQYPLEGCSTLECVLISKLNNLISTVVTLKFASSQVLVEESQGSAQIVVTKIGHNVVPVVVTIHTEDSTAKGMIFSLPR